MPASVGSAVVACAAPYGVGGTGQCLAAVVEELRTEGALAHYLTVRRRPGDPAGHHVRLDRSRRLLERRSLPISFAWREGLAGILFDAAVARRLPPADGQQSFVGFAGQALRSFRRARRLGYGPLVLESPTSHVDHVRRRHRAATSAYPIEPSWLSESTYRRTLGEYEEADEIVVLSEYARETFERAGVPAAKLRRRVVLPATRFAPPARREPEHSFRIVYSGRLQVTKGVPVLLDAVSRIPNADVRLILVGGTATASMDRYLRARQSADGRVTLASGDPLSFLHRADAFVHPSFEDGFGFAPAEALATGLPVIVTEDTGMKENVVPGRNGYLVPTGDVSALVEALGELRAHPLVDAVPLDAA